ncbi:hypothetical protein QN219_06165 [Sinorhizobium sp. 7-81]|uniref:hypothetical protein n=1 Tax=Sinorhizobium sp. 8-89 TaxID=3049089 RepID=UPI0024C254B5|nr:hypothetical protein [Sinorhizobium sp. 8-89]MDK1489641.1 hypothetical protein [Sinorhizobium sp. 8-89]
MPPVSDTPFGTFPVFARRAAGSSNRAPAAATIPPSVTYSPGKGLATMEPPGCSRSSFSEQGGTMPKALAQNIGHDHPDRDLECQRALDDDFHLLIALAESEGWTWQEIALALMELTEDYVMAMRLDAEMKQGVSTAASRTLH